MHQEQRRQRRPKWLFLAYSLLVWKGETVLGFHFHPLCNIITNKQQTSIGISSKVFALAQPKRNNRARFWTPHKQPARPLSFSPPPATVPSATSAPSLDYGTGASLDVPWKQVLVPRNEGDLVQHAPQADDNSGSPYSASALPVEHPKLTASDQLFFGGAVLALVSLFVSLVAWSGDARFYLAGGICAAVSHLVPVPVDVVKTRKQVDPKLSDTTFVQATRKILQTEGLKSLFVGSGPTFWGYFMEGAVKFGVYEVLKPLVRQWIPWSQHVAFLVSAAISGMAASVMLCPMEALRIRLVAEPEYARMGWKLGGLRILKSEGIGAFGKGLLPMMYKQVPYTMTKNVSFDVLTKLAYATLATSTTIAVTGKSVKLAVPLACAAVASVLSCISSQPGDMLLSLVNANGGTRRTHDVARDILNSDQGVRGFFVGIRTRFLHVGIIVTMQLLIYDMVKRLCGIAATGSV